MDLAWLRQQAQQPAEIQDGYTGFIRADGRLLKDETGKQYTIKGMAFGNEVWSNSSAPPAAHHNAESYQDLAEMGFDSVRFYLNYVLFESDAAPYVYREEGFQWLDQNIAWAKAAGIRLEYQGLSKPVLCLADRELLERAVLNLLSNAFKFTPRGGTVRVTLFAGGTSLRLSVWDSGPGIAQEIQGNLFSRYLRQPGIEDSRFGLGLGMVLVRSAAAAHGGAVLIDQPEGWGTRVTISVALRREKAEVLRSPTMRIDYAGERDHALTELSDCLPVSLYKKEI